MGHRQMHLDPMLSSAHKSLQRFIGLLNVPLIVPLRQSPAETGDKLRYAITHQGSWIFKTSGDLSGPLGSGFH